MARSDMDSKITGSIIPIAPGRMRNIYFPQRKAEYVTSAQIRSMGGQKDMVIERDFGFGIETPGQQKPPGDDSQNTVDIKMKLLTVSTCPSSAGRGGLERS